MAGVTTSCMRRLFCSVHLKRLPILTVPSNTRLQRYASNSTDPSSHIHYEDISVPLLKIYGNSQKQIEVNRFLEDLLKTGLKNDDPRLSPVIATLKSQCNNGHMDHHQFIDIIQENSGLIEKALKGKFVIQDFETFSNTINDIYHQCSHFKDGKNASYIPELARIDPSLWGVSICTVNGQRHSVGNADVPFTLQSGGKCFNYSIGLDEVGREKLHQYIGMEPSGSHFNKMTLNKNGKPHNPMINAGAIVLCSLIKPHLSLHERMNFMLHKYDEFAGLPKRSIKCDMITCDSEMENCDRNMALLYYTKSKNSLPPSTSLDDTIKLYTRLCSIEIDCHRGAVLAATLANGGICPLTERQVVSNESVRHSLTLMHSCGMYDYSGEFAFNVGLPAKSGVSGVIIVVVPHVMGLCLYSPPVNTHGNSVRGLHFCRKFVETFNFHIYDNQSNQSDKIDPRRFKGTHKELNITSLMYSASTGAVSSMQRYMMKGIDLTQSNYDGRTPLHVAVSNGHLEVTKFLLEKAQVPINPIDHWSRTPLNDAEKFGHTNIIDYLKSMGAKNGI